MDAKRLTLHLLVELEMGEMYHEGEYDLAGFPRWSSREDDYIDGSAIQEGQAIIGLASNGIHSNGYSLVRKLIKESGIDLNDDFDGRTYLETFLAPTATICKTYSCSKKHSKLKE